MRFYRSGEVIRDCGIVYLYSILREMEGHYKKEYGLDFTDNYLEFICCDYSEIYEYIINVKVFENFLKGIKAEFKKLKIDEEIFGNATVESYVDIINSIDGLKLSDKKSFQKKFESKYMPYVRNSMKYGTNSNGEENFHKNFYELLRLVVELNGKELEEQKHVLNKYKPSDNICCICHSVYSTEFDITHKSEEKPRVNSRNNYMFMGSEKNTFNNYGNNKSSICFVCEFLNLIFLLYFSLKQPVYLAYVDSLRDFYFFNSKINNLRRLYNDQGFYKKLAQYNSKNIRLYLVEPDSQKGVVLRMEQVLKYDEFLKQIKLYSIINKLWISTDTNINIRDLRKLVVSRNYKSIKEVILLVLQCFDKKKGQRVLNVMKTLSNIKLMLEMLEIESNENGGVDLGKDYKTFFYAGKALGEKIPIEAKNTVGFKLIQMLKTDNRDGIIKFLYHSFMANSIPIPVYFSKGILDSEDSRELTYNIGVFLEGFFN
ncbi:hypothetical protein RBH29_06050 [Herbivorax sp. ANBcel31]|uniref:hypothetical protein n=1 Tax=Herbivorax sp. ANBcel31 TaxID=3069754 RepID=UPI0027B4E0D5|nr:hypothetical protein [Herbivorax sp. ANBcel31]MDQ2086002.1 hypothetical protein [Herbivorax sp. ANBcel31]